MLRKAAAMIMIMMLVLAITMLAVPSAFAQATGQISGTATDVSGKLLPNTAAQVRNTQTGQLVGNTTTNAQGLYSFTGLNPGTYIVELVSSTGAIIGTTAPITLAAGALIATGVGVTATAAGAAAAGGAAAAAGGIGAFFGTTAGIITGVAIAGGITAGVIAAKGEASPSR